MNSQHNLLALAESYLRESVAPIAARLDADQNALQNAFKELGARGLLGLRVPEKWGGAGVSACVNSAFQEMVARYSGALAFLQTQHQSAALMITNSDSSALKQEYLPHLATGKRCLGVGFSQLRRPGKPLLNALPTESGFLLNGEVPWVTGFGCFKEFIAAATLPDGQAVFGIVPFFNTIQESGGEIVFSQPLQLIAMTSTNTVTAHLSNWFLPKQRVVFIKQAGWIQENDKKNVLNPAFFALGCARAGLDIVEAAAKNKPFSFICETFEALNRELKDCRARCYNLLDNNSYSFAEKLQLRAWAIELAVRCAHAAITVSSGAANYQYHAAGRVYREALVFTVSAQTSEVMAATLKRLIHSVENSIPHVTFRL
ncbi:MAG: acyl-CoA dehydrogenase family protein [Oscillatoriaceae bacterium SKW80]|nr:acyl-CoA dehydrogenase family protein [Oscillatoriaceae bacterium SKYG93]MCX8119711.1 acyl-CoA dehydrogenase family protein [Oscillatoriaceae bacterium SKW80]MDW8452412.1 acyl-CoA dehydrogenase family protein [Oscillatoriaceae cyanobacterium SKYGB_i_bin93]HIK27615.1 acyl-CoA dehydrogenase family protein [Oscillatoriaceae cyanobacterium M7585_C2015_266]